jgi:hypothetical protein
MPSFFMATTIKVDGTIAPFTWQDDQLLDEDSLVDYFVPAANLVDTLVPYTTVGTGSDS